MHDFTIEHSSFRDPSGFIFYEDGVLYRQVNESYKEDYELLMTSGLYENLVCNGLLIPHQETDVTKKTDACYKTIQPDLISYVSYPYEWSFSQLKNAALTTIRIQRTAMKYGMMLKDASAYNIQFMRGKPVLVDTLSFEKYEEGQMWKAYRQFCQHFFAPLVLMSCKDIRLGQLLRVYIDGLPLDLVSKLLPARTKMAFSVLSHIHLHAKSQKHYERKPIDVKKRKMSLRSLEGLVESLSSGIKKLRWAAEGTEWGSYYSDTNYSDSAFDEKKEIVSEFIDTYQPKVVWDLGANQGLFSRIASNKGINTISFDIDPAAVEQNYLECASRKEDNILPLLLDLTNPSAGIGWENNERMSFMRRGPADAVFALALVHHLAISNNVPLNKLAEFFSSICSRLIIEFVPKSDSQVKRLLVAREDIFADYTKTAFEAEFTKLFSILKAVNLSGSERTLYVMERVA